jgi:BON domain
MGTIMMRSDLMVHAAVCTALRRALGPVAGRIGVRVHDGVVTLTGSVETPDRTHAAEQTAEVTSASDYSAIERALECVPGVRGVTSEVRLIEPAGNAPAGRVTAKSV